MSCVIRNPSKTPKSKWLRKETDSVKRDVSDALMGELVEERFDGRKALRGQDLCFSNALVAKLLVAPLPYFGVIAQN